MKYVLTLMLWFIGTVSVASTQSVAPPAWLVQVAAQKQQLPEKMLDVLMAREAEFAELNVEHQAYWLNQLASIYSSLGRFNEQQQAAQQGLALLNERADTVKAELMFELGYAKEMQLELAEALNWYTQGAALADQLEHPALQVRGLINIAAIDSLQDRDQQAMASLKLAYEMASQLQSDELLADVNAQLGLLYSSLSFEQEAQAFLEQALTLYETLGWQKNRISVLYNLARNDSYLQNFEHALRHFEQMLQLAQLDQDMLNLYYAYSGLAITSNEMGRPQVALNYMQKAEEYLNVLQSEYYMAGHYYEKAMIYKKLQQNTQAMQQLIQAEQLFKKLDDQNAGNMLLALRYAKAELYAEQGQFERAHQQLLEFVHGFQQFRDKENELALASMRLSFEADREQTRVNLSTQQEQLTTLKQDIVLQKDQLRLQKWLIFILTGCLLLSLVLLVRANSRRLTQPPPA